MTLTKAALAFLIALILFVLAFLWEFGPAPFPAGRIVTLAWCFVAAGLLLTQ